jgi:hypothetical protein
MNIGVAVGSDRSWLLDKIRTLWKRVLTPTKTVHSESIQSEYKTTYNQELHKERSGPIKTSWYAVSLLYTNTTW